MDHSYHLTIPVIETWYWLLFCFFVGSLISWGCAGLRLSGDKHLPKRKKTLFSLRIEKSMF